MRRVPQEISVVTYLIWRTLAGQEKNQETGARMQQGNVRGVLVPAAASPLAYHI